MKCFGMINSEQMLLRDFELKWNQVTITAILNIKIVIQKTHKGRRNKGPT